MENKKVIYLYLYNDEVVYVGQSNRGIVKRVKEHCKEIRFYGLTDVYYYELSSTQDASAHEAYWIKYYKPILNIQRPSLTYGLKRKPTVQWKKYPFEIIYDEPLIKPND